MRDYLVTCFFSSSVNKLIILENDGEIGCSSLADMRTLIVAKFTIRDFGKFITPIILMYLSRIPAATNKVSGLYSFF
tara:strand:- start:99 stop:329 length:231 start_codon:yes stop_codon:yes gene_type:complete